MYSGPNTAVSVRDSTVILFLVQAKGRRTPLSCLLKHISAHGPLSEFGFADQKFLVVLLRCPRVVREGGPKV